MNQYHRYTIANDVWWTNNFAIMLWLSIITYFISYHTYLIYNLMIYFVAVTVIIIFSRKDEWNKVAISKKKAEPSYLMPSLVRCVLKPIFCVDRDAVPNPLFREYTFLSCLWLQWFIRGLCDHSPAPFPWPNAANIIAFQGKQLTGNGKCGSGKPSNKSCVR